MAQELKARTARSIADEEDMLELGADCSIVPTQVYEKSEVDAVLAEKDKEIRRLKRALWLARAERATAIKWHEGLERYLHERKKFWPSRFCFMAYDEMYHVWYKCWCKVENKCRAKAEEYK